MSLMVSISGVRGIVGRSLTPEVAVRYTAAFADYCRGGTIVIGRDGRATGAPIASIVSSTLLAKGCNVVALGIVPTPTIGLAVEELGAAGGISVTASHNPMEWNGFKFIGAAGMFLDHPEHAAFLRLVRQPPGPYAGWDTAGTHRRDDSLLERHLTRIFSAPELDPGSVRGKRFRIVTDCINAAGGAVIPRLLRELGCEVVEMNCDLSGVFSRPPEPLPENLAALGEMVREQHADLGIAVDPDVDRLVLMDEKGEPFGEENTVAMAVGFVLSKRSSDSGAVVVNLSTTRAVDDIAKKYGATVYRTPVGEINVAVKMKEVGAVIGGEGSGGVIFPRVHYMRDAVAGAAIVLQQLSEFGGTLSAFRKTLPRYVIRKAVFRPSKKEPEVIMNDLAENRSEHTLCNTDDGLKLEFSDSWIHIRKSNTEPIVRIIAEAPTAAAADELISRFGREFR